MPNLDVPILPTHIHITFSKMHPDLELLESKIASQPRLKGYPIRNFRLSDFNISIFLILIAKVVYYKISGIACYQVKL